MSNELREGDIARDVAQSLASEFGSNVITETEKQLAAGASGKRGFMPNWATDAAAIAGIIIGAVQLVRQLYSERKADKKLDELKAILEACPASRKDRRPNPLENPATGHPEPSQA